MTTATIRADLAEAGKPVSRATLYNYLTELGIQPSGANQRPQQYPADTAAKIIVHLGLEKTVAHALRNGNGKLATMPELRKARKKARGAK